MKNKILIGSLLFTCILSTTVKATTIKMNADKTELKAGDEITIQVMLEDVDIPGGINVIQGKLEYDKKIFEKVENNDFIGKNNWSMTYNDEDTASEGKWIILNLSKGQEENQELVECKLKVKDNARGKKNTIKLTELETTDNENIINLEDSQIEVKIEKKSFIKSLFKQVVDSIMKIFN